MMSLSSKNMSSRSVIIDSLSQCHSKHNTVFVGRIPRRMDISVIYQMLQSCGPIKMIVPTRDTYLFCEYEEKSFADTACRNLNATYVGQSRIVVISSASLKRLFVGGVPNTVVVSHIEEAIKKLCPEGTQTSVELFRDDGNQPSSPSATSPKHRGFAFIEFVEHSAAHNALKNMVDLGFFLPYTDISDNGEPFPSIIGCKVDWAEPLAEIPASIMAGLRVLYVSNLVWGNETDSVASESALIVLFSQYGPLERVKRLKNFAFVHFFSRSHAQAALDGLQGYILGGQPIKIQWSKPPVSRSTPKLQTPPLNRFPLNSKPNVHINGNNGNMYSNYPLPNQFPPSSIPASGHSQWSPLAPNSTLPLNNINAPVFRRADDGFPNMGLSYPQLFEAPLQNSSNANRAIQRIPQGYAPNIVSTAPSRFSGNSNDDFDFQPDLNSSSYILPPDISAEINWNIDDSRLLHHSALHHSAPFH
jgi:RNA recognition motif-containing protein